MDFGQLDYMRHEGMKAVLLNSANKINDDDRRTVNGIHVPKGGFLGMDRTVIDTNRHDWLRLRPFWTMNLLLR